MDNDKRSFSDPELGSVDDLIASAKAELEKNDALTSPDAPQLPEQAPQTAPEPAAADEPQSIFEPDFGHAFDDYGEYTDERRNAPEPEPYAERERGRKHLKRARFPGVIKALIYIGCCALLGVLLATVGWKMADDVLALSRPDEDVVITIDSNDTVEDITAKLKSAGVIEYEWLFKLYCKVSKSENYFDPGVYTINLTYDYHALVNNLMASAGNRESVKIMIIEGADCFDIFKLLDENGVCTRAALEEASANYHFDYSFLNGLPYGEMNRLEGYLFPDTYEFYLNDEPQNVLVKFLDNFEKKMDEDILAALDAGQYSMHEILTVASIIEGEAANDEERAKVASVIYNRLTDWDLPYLNMDSTVYYAAAVEGTSFSLELESPYNTYLHTGLPTGPINNPSIKSIRAALAPADTDYYYFATATDGLNRFFHSQDDFNAFLNSDEFRTSGD